jgi:hypothetical protein
MVARSLVSLRRLAVLLAVTVAILPTVVVPAPPETCAPPVPLGFDAPSYVDETRAGGEPMIHTHPDGTLLYGAHAGTTHFYSPAAPGESTPAFTDNYNGQTYFWWSDDNGKTRTYAERPAPENDYGSGFSDPDVAIDTAGNVYISEINLVNVAMSRSTDAGRTYELQNFFAMTITDRQWTEADTPGVVYMVGNAFAGGTSSKPAGNNGHFLYVSKDGGQTWTPGQADMERGYGLGDLRVDKRNGTLYEMHYEDADDNEHSQELSIAAFRKARNGDMTPELHTVAKGVSMNSHWPALDIDPNGNLYVTWDEDGDGDAKRAAGIYYSFSRDQGRSWSKPLRVDPDDRTDIWPWLAVGDEGRVAIAWLQAEIKLPEENAETQGDHGWDVAVAGTITGLGCAASAIPGFNVTTATPEPLHRGTICMGGTVCQAEAVDRRLGDYFSIEIDATGRMVAAYSDTRREGAVSLPAFFRQKAGPSFFGGSLAPSTAKPATVVKPKPVVKGAKQTLPATGIGGTAAVAGLAMLAAALVFGRRMLRHS